MDGVEPATASKSPARQRRIWGVAFLASTPTTQPYSTTESRESRVNHVFGVPESGWPRAASIRSRQWLDCDVAELDRVVVAGETEEAGNPVLARMGRVGHEILDGAQVGVENH